MKRMISGTALLGLAFLLFTAAKCNKEKYEYSAETKVEISKTPCFGRCPTYTFTLNGQGEATYNGRKFVELEGDHTRVFPIDTTNVAFATLIAADLWQYQDEYTAPVTDLPTTYLSFHHDGKSKRIKLYAQYPQELEALVKELEALAFSKGWVKK
ncbi:MAG TPA: DUF6438 domain-containing protein [Saprospiraceae bacterium]|nr:DUF6438 domain-containing protein [Saprospiraceae bacterium]HMQ81763.1 DUF6438 domain-containing protein [Saprospiraceae bacterium]